MMNDLFTKILTVMISVAISVWVSTTTVKRTLSERQITVPLTKVLPKNISITNFITVTNFVTVTNFFETVSSNVLIGNGIPLPTDTQSVTSISIEPPTQINRLREISEELVKILEDLKGKEK